MEDHRPDEDELDRPVTEHLIRQAQIAAGSVRRFRHGMSVLLPCATTSDFGAVGCRSDGELSLDTLTRQLIRERYEFRFVTTPDRGEALALEREVQRGALSAGRGRRGPRRCERVGPVVPYQRSNSSRAARPPRSTPLTRTAVESAPKVEEIRSDGLWVLKWLAARDE